MSKTPPRRERREQQRRLVKDVRERERLAKLLPGGNPDRPIAVQSASVIEVQAKSTPCPLCGGELRVDEHNAKTFGGDILRVVLVHCHQCGAKRELYFRVAPVLAS